MTPGRRHPCFNRYLPGLVVLLPVTAGCGIDYEYLVPQILGQVDILERSVPISEAINSGNLSEEEVEKLLVLLDARRFARDHLGLNTRGSYTLFYDTGGEPIAYNVSACAKHVFAPKRWTFPIVGTVPYLGFFDWPQAARKINELIAQSYDVLWYEVDAYSTLDYLPNPVFSAMLRRSDLSLVETVIHELLHNTIWHTTATSFNESLATYVGRTGALDYFANRYPGEPTYVETAVQWCEDNDRYNVFLFELYEELDAFYSRDISWQQRVAGRETLYQAGRDRFVAEVLPLMNRPENFEWVADLPTNNAWLLSNVRYNLNLDLFDRVHAAGGGDWRASLRVFRAAARAGDPYAYLRQWSPDDGNAKSTFTDAHHPSEPGAPATGPSERAAQATGLQEPRSSFHRGPCPKPTRAAHPFR